MVDYQVGDDSIVAQLSVGDASFWVADESPENGNYSPETVGGCTTRMLLIEDDPDAAVSRPWTRARHWSTRARTSTAGGSGGCSIRSATTGRSASRSARGRRRMADVLIDANTIRSPELRHEIPAGVIDPFLYGEADGVAFAAVSSLDAPTIAAARPELRQLDMIADLGLMDLIRTARRVARHCWRCGCGRAGRWA